MILFEVKLIGNTLNYLIQQTNDRITLHYKRKMKRNQIKGIASTSLPSTNTTNELNRVPHSSPTNSSLLSSSSIFNSVQEMSVNPMPPTATRNPSVGAMAAKKTAPSLASLLTSNTSMSSNVTYPFDGTSLDRFNSGNISPTKQTKSTKTTAATDNANKGSEYSRRGAAAVKRLIES